jgi:hypothetical protein
MSTETVDALIIDLLLWIDMRERTYEEVLNAWRTSCPKLPVWEDANDRGLVAVETGGGQSLVRITSTGRAFLEHATRADPS